MFKNELIDSSQKIGAVALSYIPLGLASDIGLAGVGFTPLGITLMSVIAFTGSGQFMTSSMVGLGASVSSILTLNLFLSLRMSLMTSSLSQYVRGRSKGFLALFGQTTNYSENMLSIIEFAIGNTADEIETAVDELEELGEDDAIADVVSGATFVDTNGYLQAIVDAMDE